MVRRIWNMTTTALGRAALDAEITRQAAIIAYVDDYKFMMLIALAAMPIIFLLRKGGGTGHGRPRSAGVIWQRRSAKRGEIVFSALGNPLQQEADRARWALSGSPS
jgi:hypothetical protein